MVLSELMESQKVFETTNARQGKKIVIKESVATLCAMQENTIRAEMKSRVESFQLRQTSVFETFCFSCGSVSRRRGPEYRDR
jgi:hypothetical protein